MLLSATILFALFVLAVVLDGFLTRLPSLAGNPARGERIGVIHVHTNASCGSGSLPQVIAAAKDADLSFVAITDHNLTLSDAEVAEADPPDFAVIDGEEVSTAAGHYLALGTSDSRWHRGAGLILLLILLDCGIAGRTGEPRTMTVSRSSTMTRCGAGTRFSALRWPHCFTR